MARARGLRVDTGALDHLRAAIIELRAAERALEQAARAPTAARMAAQLLALRGPITRLVRRLRP